MKKQHGFHPSRSTTTYNLVFSNFFDESFKLGSQIDVVYTDFNKAFDSMNHSILIKILEKSVFGKPLFT